jgi:hypothetical protein
MGRFTARLDAPASPYPRSTAAAGPAIVLVIIVAVAGVALGAWALADGGGITGTALGAAIALLLLVGLAALGTLLAYPRKGRLEVVTDDGRLWLPSARPFRLLTLVGLTICIALGVVVLIGLVVERSLAGPVIASVGAVALAVVCVPVLAAHVRGAVVLPKVGLGPDDVVRLSGRAVQVVRWEDVDSADAVTDPAPRVLVVARRPVPTSFSSRSTPGERPVGGPPTRPDQLPIATNLHGSDPRLVEMLLRHYLRHPTHRVELGTPAAEDRVRRGDLGS